MPKKRSNLKVLKHKLDKLTAHANLLDKKLKEELTTQLIYYSSVVEGVNLSMTEVKEVVKLGKRSKLLKGDPKKELVQAFGQKKAYETIERWAKEKTPVNIKHLLKLHQVIFQKLDQYAGQYRQSHIKLRSSVLMPSFPFAIAADMADFDKWLQQTQQTLTKDDIEGITDMVTRVYHSVTKIHPFSDGNGRSARLFVNLLLRRYHLPYIIVPKVDNEKQTREVLRAADMGNIQPLKTFMEKLLADSLKTCLHYWQS